MSLDFMTRENQKVNVSFFSRLFPTYRLFLYYYYFFSYTSPFSSFPIPTHTLCSYCVTLELLSAEKYTPNVPDVPQEAPSSVHFVLSWHSNYLLTSKAQPKWHCLADTATTAPFPQTESVATSFPFSWQLASTQTSYLYQSSYTRVIAIVKWLLLLPPP